MENLSYTSCTSPSFICGELPYNPALSLWLSVDPLSDKYPNLSPYVYCADNPVRLVDVDGREIGDYYNFKGEWLGTDNKRDGKIYFGESIANRKVSTCYNDLYYAQQDYDLSIGTPESSMEFATVLQSGEIEHYKSSSSAGDQVRVNAGSTTENPSGTFEHSHPINFANGYAGPELLSNKDIESFKYFQLNIVVGQTIPEDAYSMRIPMCCFYDCNSTLLGSIEMKDLKKVIADQFVRNNMLIVPTELLIK